MSMGEKEENKILKESQLSALQYARLFYIHHLIHFFVTFLLCTILPRLYNLST